MESGTLVNEESFVIATERLSLRKFSVAPNDLVFIRTLLNQPSFHRFIGDKGVRTLDDARKYLDNGPIDSYQRHGFGLYLVELTDNKPAIGMCGLVKRDSLPHVDLGFAFLPEFWAKGYAFEAAAAVLKYARELLKLDRILAITDPDNEASIKLLQKLGFEFDGMIKLSDDAPEIKLFSQRRQP